MTMDAYWPGTKVLRSHTQPGARGAVLANDAGHAVAVSQLNQALAIAAAVTMRSKDNYFASLRHFSPTLAALALDRAHASRNHAARICARIGDLGGQPDAPSSAWASPSETPASRDAGSLVGLISGELAAGNATISSYRKVAAYFAPSDATTHTLLEEIVAAEEQFASMLAGLLTKAAAPFDC